MQVESDKAGKASGSAEAGALASSGLVGFAAGWTGLDEPELALAGVTA